MSIVLGLGGTVDYEIQWDQTKLQALAQDWGIRWDELTPDLTIHDERSLLVSLLSMIANDSGGERYVDLVETLTDFGEHFSYRITQGGTCVRAALILAQAGIRSTVHLVSTDRNVRRLMPPEVTMLCSAKSDTLDPHLIIQYPAGVDIPVLGGTVRSTHANRLIFAHDVANRELELHPDLAGVAEGSDVFLISGFNVMKDREKLTDRLNSVIAAAEAVAPNGLIFFEDADYHDDSFRRQVNEAIGPITTIHSMNEDELQSYLGRKINLLEPQQVADALIEIKRVTRSPRQLVHSKYWAILYGSQAEQFTDSLQMAVDVASARYLYGDELSLENVTDIRKETVAPRVRSFVERLAELLPGALIVPGYQLSTDSPTTIGLGDSFVGGFLLGRYRRQLSEGVSN